MNRNLLIILVLTYIFTSATTKSGSGSCSSSSQCSRNRVCVNRKCKSCESNSQCSAPFPSKPYCKINRRGGNTCEECLINSHCPLDSKSRCKDSKCSPCNNNDDCSHISGGRIYCSSSKVCVQCDAANPCPGTDVCDVGFCSAGPNTGCASPCSDYQRPYCGPSEQCKSCGAAPTNPCPGSLLCSSDGSCQTCYEDDHCSNELLSRCVIGTPNACQVCLDNSQCAHIPGKNKCLAGLKCVECISSFDCSEGYACQNNVCVVSAVAPIEVKVSGTDAPDTYIIEFPPALIANANVIDGIFIELADTDSSTYSYSLSMISNTKYQVRFKVTKTIPITTLLLTYTYTQYGSSLNDILPQFDANTATKRIPYIPESQRAISEAMQAVGQAATTAMAATSGSIMVLGGSPAILWALINLIQTFYYLIFVNVNYPANVQFFLKIFTLADFDFIPNPITWFNPELEDEYLPVPARFEEYDINGLFLNNAGNMLLIWFVVLAIYAASAIGYKYLNRLSRIATLFFSKMIGWFEWGGVLRALTASYAELAQASFLQLRVLTYYPSSYAASSVVALLFAIYAVIFPFLAFMMIKKFVHPENKAWKKYEALTEEYTPEGKYPKYFTAIFLFKRLLIILSLVFLHDYAYMEIFFLTFLSLLTIILLIKFKPYETKTTNYVNIVTEVLFLIVHVLIMVLIHDDHTTNFTEDQRLNLGWGLIVVCGIIVMISLGVTVAEQVKMLKEGWKLIKQLIQKETKKEKKLHIKPQRYVETSENPLNVSNVTVQNISVINASVMEKSPFMKRQDIERLHGLGRAEQLQIDSFEGSIFGQSIE